MPTLQRQPIHQLSEHRFDGVTAGRDQLRVGMPLEGQWREALNTDSPYYSGSGIGNLGLVEAAAVPWHEQPFSASLTLPPLGAVWLVPAETQPSK